MVYMGQTSSHCTYNGHMPVLYRVRSYIIIFHAPGKKNVTELATHHKAMINKAIRDGKYLAPPHASAWQRSPH